MKNLKNLIFLKIKFFWSRKCRSRKCRKNDRKNKKIFEPQVSEPQMSRPQVSRRKTGKAANVGPQVSPKMGPQVSGRKCRGRKCRGAVSVPLLCCDAQSITPYWRTKLQYNARSNGWEETTTFNSMKFWNYTILVSAGNLWNVQTRQNCYWKTRREFNHNHFVNIPLSSKCCNDGVLLSFDFQYVFRYLFIVWLWNWDVSYLINWDMQIYWKQILYKITISYSNKLHGYGNEVANRFDNEVGRFKQS